MTYARARLWLGILSVGTFVVLAVVLLVSGAPARWLASFETGGAGDLTGLVLIVVAYVLVSLPFDVFGGYLLPRRYGRLDVSRREFAAKWLRGVVVHGVVMVTAGWLILMMGRNFGLSGAGAAVAALMLLMVALQARLARLVAHLPRVGRLPAAAADQQLDSAQVLHSDDVGFAGGFTGLPGRERLIVPQHWLVGLTRRQLETQLLRRRGVLENGLRTRGLVVALAWNVGGFLLAALAPGSDVATLAGLVTLALWFTLWSFLGLLFLPTLSRGAVFAADRYALAHGATRAELRATIEQLDRWQDDEPARPAVVETIFHPVPSVTSRLERLARGRQSFGAYHAARMALPLSWACLGFLARAVHGNSGRPELWVMLPGD